MSSVFFFHAAAMPARAATRRGTWRPLVLGVGIKLVEPTGSSSPRRHSAPPASPPFTGVQLPLQLHPHFKCHRPLLSGHGHRAPPPASPSGATVAAILAHILVDGLAVAASPTVVSNTVGHPASPLLDKQPYQFVFLFHYLVFFLIE
jgi:hypothetical protein